MGVVPAGLTHLTFGERFNQPFEAGVLPAGLTIQLYMAAGVLLAGLVHLYPARL